MMFLRAFSLICTATMVFFASEVHAANELYTGSDLSGSQLASICNDAHHQAKDEMWIVCVSYVDGSIAGFTAAISTVITFRKGLTSRPALGDDKTVDSLLSVLEGLRCIPATTTREENAEVVIQYLKDHPDELRYPADEVVNAALINKWPCKG